MSDWRDVRVLWMREMRSALRERNIVVYSVLLPIFLYPLLMWLMVSGLTFARGQEENRASRICLRGLPEKHQILREEFASAPRFELRESANPMNDLRRGRLDAWVEFDAGGPADPASSEPASSSDLRVKIIADDARERSRMAKERVNDVIKRYRSYYLSREAERLGIAGESFQVFSIVSKNVATSRQMGQFLLGLLLPMMFIIMTGMGSTYPAIDTTAGERERSTWETMMTTRAARGDIVLAKYLYVATMAAGAGLLNVTAMVLSMKAVFAPLLGRSAEQIAFRIPAGAVPLILLLSMLLALFLSAGMMILASFARTFKDGQSMTTPFLMLVMLPAMFLAVPGLEFTPVLALVPIVNVALVLREAIAGIYHWPQIGITVVVELGCVVLALRLATAILRYEDFLLGTFGGNLSSFLHRRVFSAAKKRGGDR